MDFDRTQTDHLLTTTCAVRKRLDLTKPVPRELILDCIRISTQAPAGGNNQKWRWVVVDDPAKKAAIADAYRRSYAPYIARSSGRWRRPADMGNAKRQPAGLVGSVIPAVWSYCLAARSRGLGTVWTTLHLPFDG